MSMERRTFLQILTALVALWPPLIEEKKPVIEPEIDTENTSYIYATGYDKKDPVGWIVVDGRDLDFWDIQITKFEDKHEYFGYEDTFVRHAPGLGYLSVVVMLCDEQSFGDQIDIEKYTREFSIHYEDMIISSDNIGYVNCEPYRLQLDCNDRGFFRRITR